MWLFTRYGFYSTSLVRRGMVAVRARRRSHLTNLLTRMRHIEALKNVRISETQLRDYRYRIVLPMKIWQRILMVLAGEQTWTNFKEETREYTVFQRDGQDYMDALHQIWGVMYRFQRDAKIKPADRNFRLFNDWDFNTMKLLE